MGNFFLRRLLLAFLILFLITLVVFVVTEVLPGDTANMILGQRATPETLEALRVRLGLDRPAYVRYLAWVGGILRWDWGDSLFTQLPVGPLLVQRLRNSGVLALMASLFGIPLGIGLGIVAAQSRGRWPDHLVTLTTLFAVSLPGFVTAIFLIIVFAMWLRWLPASSMIDPQANLWQASRFLILPTLTLTLGLLAHIARHTRSSLLEVMAKDYVRTARSKGMPRRVVLLRHSLRNALLPTISVVALNVGYLFGGVVLVESVFAYPGLGQLMLQAITSRDLPLLQAAVLAVAAVYTLANLSADILYRWLNPRIRYS